MVCDQSETLKEDYRFRGGLKFPSSSPPPFVIHIHLNLLPHRVEVFEAVEKLTQIEKRPGLQRASSDHSLIIGFNAMQSLGEADRIGRIGRDPSCESVPELLVNIYLRAPLP